MEKANKFLVHYGIKGMKWDLSKKKGEYEEEKELLRRRKAEQAANRVSTTGMTKAQKEAYKAEREAQKIQNQESQAALQAKRDEIALMTAELMEKQIAYNKEMYKQKSNVEKQRARTKKLMSKFGGTKIRIV